MSRSSAGRPSSIRRSLFLVVSVFEVESLCEDCEEEQAPGANVAVEPSEVVGRLSGKV